MGSGGGGGGGGGTCRSTRCTHFKTENLHKIQNLTKDTPGKGVLTKDVDNNKEKPIRAMKCAAQAPLPPRCIRERCALIKRHLHKNRLSFAPTGSHAPSFSRSCFAGCIVCTCLVRRGSAAVCVGARMHPRFPSSFASTVPIQRLCSVSRAHRYIAVLDSRQFGCGVPVPGRPHASQRLR
jgi:hypothetical protein